MPKSDITPYSIRDDNIINIISFAHCKAHTRKTILFNEWSSLQNHHAVKTWETMFGNKSINTVLHIVLFKIGFQRFQSQLSAHSLLHILHPSCLSHLLSLRTTDELSAVARPWTCPSLLRSSSLILVCVCKCVCTIRSHYVSANPTVIPDLSLM